MVFTKNIRIQAKDLKGPGEKIYIVMVFNEDAVLTTQAEYQYIAVWKYVFHSILLIARITVLILIPARVAPFIPNKPGRQIPSVFVSSLNNTVAVGRKASH